MTAPDSHDPNSFGEELFELVCDGRRRAQGRRRLMRRLDQQIAALKHAADSDIERVRQDTQQLIKFTDVLIAMGGILNSLRDPSQLHKVEKKLADLKTELAARAASPRLEEIRR